MTKEVEKLLETAIEQLEFAQGLSGCNDMIFPDTPEIRALWKEYNIWNCPEANNSKHDQWMPLRKSGDEWIGNDGFLVFLLRKHLNLL